MINLDFTSFFFFLTSLIRTVWDLQVEGSFEKIKSNQGTSKDNSEFTAQNKDLQIPQGRHPLTGR